MEEKIKSLQEKVETLIIEKKEIEDNGSANLEKLIKVEDMLKVKTDEMEHRELNLQNDWANLVKDHNVAVKELEKKKEEHNVAVKELEKKKEELKTEEQTLMYQKLDLKRQSDIYLAKQNEIIRSHDLINKQKLKLEKQDAEISKLKKDAVEASKGLWTTQQVESAVEDKESQLEATRELLDQKDKELISLKVNMGESLTKNKETKQKLQEKITKEKELTEEKEKLEENLKKMEDKIENEQKDLKKTLNNFSKKNASLEKEVEDAKKLKNKIKNAEKEVSLMQEKYTEICKESQKWKKEKEMSDIEALKLKKENDELKSKLKEARIKTREETSDHAERKDSSKSKRESPERENSYDREKRQERSERTICAKYIMGHCKFGLRCWNTHKLTEDQVERAIEAGIDRKKNESERSDASHSRGGGREGDDDICVKYLMGLCHFGDNCWHTHKLNREQVDRAIEAGKGRRQRDESERRREASRNRERKRDEDENSRRNDSRKEKTEDEKKREFLEVYKLWEESQNRNSKN